MPHDGLEIRVFFDAMYHVFIRTNDKQILGAKLGKYAILRTAAHPDRIKVSFINVDRIPLFKAFEGKRFLRNGEKLTYSLDDLQSFTLAAFMAPELAGYEGRAIVIDPDIFAVADVEELFARDMQGKAVAARAKRGKWDTSVMLLDCAKLRRWDMAKLLDDLAAFRTSYEEWMSLKKEDVLEIEPVWNSWDELMPETKMLHTTNRLTQPWKTGLRVDFTRHMGRYFGVVPRAWIAWMRGKYPLRYQRHPDAGIERFFLGLARDAMKDGALTEAEVRAEIAAGHVRTDLLEAIASVREPSMSPTP